MGLDWNPGPKAKPGNETEFEKLWRAPRSKFWWNRARKDKRLREITIPAFETLNAPRVGFDKVADDWARNRFAEQKTAGSEQAFLRKMKGFYVLDLVERCDGIPWYSNGSAGGYVERCSMRAQFLVRGCEEILGDELLDQAYVSKLPAETVAYGEALLRRATEFGEQKGIRPARGGDEESDEERLDIVVTAARWCQFWGERGHWLEAYY